MSPHDGLLRGTYIVTGGAQGLAAAVAAAISQHGGTLAAFDLKPPAANQAFTRVNVADAEAVRHAVDEVAGDNGLAGVVACAGIDACGRLEDVPFEAWERVIRVNLVGTAALVRAALPHFPADGSGRIVTVAST